VTGPVIVSGVRPEREQAEQAPKPLPATPYRGERWPFPSTCPAARHAMLLEHQAQQRAAIVGGPEALL
jgi:hypothetical protein